MPIADDGKDKSNRESHNDKADKKSHKGKHKGHEKDHTRKEDKKVASGKEYENQAPKGADTKESGHPGGPATCAEHGVWTDVTRVRRPQTNQQPLQFSSIDPEENRHVLSSSKMSFAMVGCSGDPTTRANTKAVAKAITADKDLSFFYHLGDIIYTLSGSDTEGVVPVVPYSPSLWDTQFFGPYRKFKKKIFAIAGNHDGKYKEKIKALSDYFRFFCAGTVKRPTGAKHRRRMAQPYIYWRMDTPYACIIGLYSNIANGGILDNPTRYTTSNFTDGPQYKWLVEQLQAVAAMNKTAGTRRKAVLLMVHYPPYSGATNFNVRGDTSKGGPVAKGKRSAQPNNYDVPCLAVALQQAFKDSGQRPDVIFSAHAHLFERLNYKFADGSVMPCLITGCGGHSPLENLFDTCDGTMQKARRPPFDAVKPGSFQFPKGDRARVKCYEDGENGGHFGYLKVTIDDEERSLTCEFMGVKHGKAKSLDRHTISI